MTWWGAQGFTLFELHHWKPVFIKLKKGKKEGKTKTQTEGSTTAGRLDLCRAGDKVELPMINVCLLSVHTPTHPHTTQESTNRQPRRKTQVCTKESSNQLTSGHWIEYRQDVRSDDDDVSLALFHDDEQTKQNKNDNTGADKEYLKRGFKKNTMWTGCVIYTKIGTINLRIAFLLLLVVIFV